MKNQKKSLFVNLNPDYLLLSCNFYKWKFISTK